MKALKKYQAEAKSVRHEKNPSDGKKIVRQKKCLAETKSGRQKENLPDITKIHQKERILSY